MPEHSNHLIHETSPYLLQHAHNPVDWFAWGDEALNKAKEENKPILVSIGYAACHWCHVMEKESFEDEATAAIMNQHFINIKIDREERPDLDHIYMDAVQAMTGSGGWPLNVFLTPDAKPFYGGTYFPPKRAFNRPSWQEILRGVAASFNERRDEIDKQAETLTEHLVKSNAFGLESPGDPALSIGGLNMDETAENLLKSGDKEWGGFGNAPKFPQTFSIVFLLRYHLVKSGREGKPGPALEQAMLSLDKMIQGGIYDQVGGGFARYSTDAEWLAPHFEKMLYDNALLITALSEAYQLTRKPRYKEVIEETIRFIQRELLFTGAGTGFYSALDADSEGEEGRFYVWDLHEVKAILGDDADVYASYYDVSSNGNWEGKNILRVKEPLEEFAVRKKAEASALKDLLKRGSGKLLKQRSKRVRPLLDDKIILGWNALMNTACSKAFEATGNEEYRELAIANMQFLLQKFNAGSDNELRHVWSRGGSKYPAFLDDYAFLIEALIHLQEITSDKDWLKKAEGLTKYVIAQFGEEGTGFFYYTPSGQTDVIVRKKELYDGAVPSGNSVMAWNLYRLSILVGRNEWKERSLKVLGSLGKAIVKYPGSFGNWASLLQEIRTGTAEIVIIGPEYRELVEELLKEYVPHRVLLAGQKGDPTYPMMAEKEAGKMSLIWLCKDFRCLLPVGSVKALRTLIDSPDSFN